ncbi:helix-turn-helix domain-containing protein (plasmid) [Halorussus salilacus]|uniref:helix-turn-helix domain-containing protein n=1 Tax=Halorussus salilacus TaxID=2953750 RepID=UPI0020A05194|nr:helix-turn-helix domain-containing protein [Halorussus salilacus]USZ69960.1 helix-turn-helix domain-containing protein [Halorussus salilacus]
MDKLDGVSRASLRAELDAVESAKAAKRLMVALAYKDGVPVSTLSERYGIPESTLYYWLDRFAAESVSAAVEDGDRPGRPSELDDADREAVFGALADSPEAYGFDAASWTPELVRDLIEREYGVSYSLGHVRRLIREADAEE